MILKNEVFCFECFVLLNLTGCSAVGSASGLDTVCQNAEKLAMIVNIGSFYGSNP